MSETTRSALAISCCNGISHLCLKAPMAHKIFWLSCEIKLDKPQKNKPNDLVCQVVGHEPMLEIWNASENRHNIVRSQNCTQTALADKAWAKETTQTALADKAWAKETTQTAHADKA